MARLTATGDPWLEWRMQIHQLALVVFLALSASLARADDEYKQVCARQRLMRATYLKNKQAFLSMAACYADYDSSVCSSRIKDEYKLAKESGGGMVDKAKIYDLQQCIKNDRELKRTLLLRLSQAKQKPLNCAMPSLRVLLACVESDSNQPICTKPPNDFLVSVLSAYFDTLLETGIIFVACGDDYAPFDDSTDAFLSPAAQAKQDALDAVTPPS